MDSSAQRDLRGRRILIVESEILFLDQLVSALENDGAETVHVTDPYSDAGAERIGAYTCCAAALNSVHHSIAKLLDVPVLVYGSHTEVPARVDAIVRELQRLLSE